jgi:uncharacterized protein
MSCHLDHVEANKTSGAVASDNTEAINAFLAGHGLSVNLVIDCHTHIGTAWNLPRPSAGADDLVSMMDELGVHVSCVSGLRALAGDLRGGNDDILRALEDHEERLVGAAVFNPHYGGEGKQELLRMLDKPGVGMIKVHPCFHSYPLSGAQYDPVWQLASMNRIPVLAHTWGSGPGYDTPEQVRIVAERYPAVPLIMAHSGGTPEGMAAAIEVAKACPNTYLDLAVSLVHRGAVSHIVREVGASRVLFGTDMVYLAGPPQVGKILAETSAAEAELVFGQNMLWLLTTTGQQLPALTALGARQHVGP